MTGFSPLPASSSSSHTQKFIGNPYILGPQWTHLPVLTIGLLGVQIFWSVEMGYASPYLLSLGLSKSAMAIVFLAGPLSGLLMQPIIGVLADTSTSRFGRRRPYMLLGTTVCVAAMLLLGYTRAFAGLFTTLHSTANDALTIALAVVAIYVIDFSINAVMAMDRALLVDTLPPSSQAAGNAWAARMLGIGAVVGFFVGTVPLPRMFPFLGTTQLQVLSVIVSILLFAGHAVMAVCVKERVLVKNTDHALGSAKRPNAFVREMRELWANILTLPPVIRQICIIQFFAWIAWFPILFYTTIYIGDLYRRSTPPSPSASPDDRDAEATRLGTRALFYSAILSLFLNLVLPAFVATPASALRSRSGSGWREGRAGTERWWNAIRIPERAKVDLASMWAVSHLVLAACMLGTLFTESVGGATLLITITGFSWAITQWAPFSLLAEAILTTPDPASAGARNSIRLSDARTPVHDPDPEAAAFLPHPGPGAPDRGKHEDDDGRERAPDHDHDDRDSNVSYDSDADADAEENRRRATSTVLGNHRARLSVSRLEIDAGAGEWDEVDEDGAEGAGGRGGGGGGLSAKAGIILGIHNVFIVVPQFLVTGLSAVIFAIFDPVAQRHPQPHILPPAPQPQPPTPAPAPAPSASASNATSMLVRALGEAAEREVRMGMGIRSVPTGEGQSNSVVYIFRIGGVSALVAFVLCWRLARVLRHRVLHMLARKDQLDASSPPGPPVALARSSLERSFSSRVRYG
ncbi:putative MFS/sugar transport protein [Lyophyllum shimeji]|uniref:MFS/sugar transport protein n=1 Tax=Lyophyllum shimeji TaxID=47721 RepID=A0A9P3UNU8_LYOSH|nr:putative MFS/sugar transport protein [Lyophyllum shimeji]